MQWIDDSFNYFFHCMCSRLLQYYINISMFFGMIMWTMLFFKLAFIDVLMLSVFLCVSLHVVSVWMSNLSLCALHGLWVSVWAGLVSLSSK